MTDKKEKEIQFKYLGFKILKSNFSVPPGRLTKKTTGTHSFELKSEFDKEKNQFQLLLKIDLSVEYRKKPNTIGQIVTLSTYEIDQLSKFIEKENVLSLPRDFIKSLVAIAISTSRGAFTALSMGIIPEKMTIPLINPDVLMPQKSK